MRMLAPFELLSQFKIADNSDIAGNMFYAKWKQSANSYMERLNSPNNQSAMLKVENKNKNGLIETSNTGFDKLDLNKHS